MEKPLSALPAGEALARYVERVSLETGEVIAGAIDPAELLVQHHRHLHPVEIHALYMTSRLARRSGSEAVAVAKLRRMRRLAFGVAEGLARRLRISDPDRLSGTLFGLRHAREAFRFRSLGLSRQEIEERRQGLEETAARRLAVAAGRLEVLVTGGSGFLGKELLSQLSRRRDIERIWVLMRPRTVRDRSSGEVIAVRTPRERGAALLDRLAIAAADRDRFRFLAGDIEAESFGWSAERLRDLGGRVTHLVHCAASVAFDASFEESLAANVVGTRHALAVSQALSRVSGSPFVAHVGVETSYIHGRHFRAPAREESLVFPRHYYNNYYELTKAMASLETERFVYGQGLPVCQLCPSIVIGEARTGNNRGDTKVVNAPVNLFGRTATPPDPDGDWRRRTAGAALARLARVFPGDPSAEINLIPVDRVVAGIVASLDRPQGIGRRVHLANDRRITAGEIRDIVRQELEVEVRLVDPTLHRAVGLPLVSRLLRWSGQDRAARVLRRMDSVFGGYAEWGQPVHEVGNDVTLLGLPPERPEPRAAFRMLCRHNRWVQEFGQVRDLDELARREAAWSAFIADLEAAEGRPAGALSAEEFRHAVRGWSGEALTSPSASTVGS